MITLDKSQAYKLMYDKQRRLKGEPRTTSKMRWRCLGCLKEIHVSFKQCSVKSVYCDECRKNKNFTNDNIVELQYVRKLKEAQMKFFENFLDQQNLI